MVPSSKKSLSPPHYLQVGGDGDVDGLAGGRDPVEEEGVVEGTVPGRLEPEHGPVVAGHLQNFPGKEAER